MKLYETYADFSRAFSYPWSKNDLLLSLTRIDEQVHKTAKGTTLAGLLEFISGSDISGIQEAFTRAFDLGPACPPYVGHHLHGDTHKKGEYMIRLKEAFREHGYEPPDNELPDHLSVIFEFAAHCAHNGAHGARRDVLAAYVLAGINKMRDSVKGKPDLPWKDLITAACILCAADCEEGSPC